MIRNEFSNFQKELYSINWLNIVGFEPEFNDFQTFNKWYGTNFKIVFF